MKQLGNHKNLIVCQKSMIDTWENHLIKHYPEYAIFNLRNAKGVRSFIDTQGKCVGLINYDLIFRKMELKELRDFTLILDESSLINNRQAKRSKFILSLKPDAVILLSGTLCGGKYERLWSQLHLLGWTISEELFFKQYVIFHYDDAEGFPIRIIDGYKNVDRLKEKLREHGAHFLKTEDVFDLPDQVDQVITIPITSYYKKFRKTRIVTVEGVELVGDTTLTKMLYERQLCGSYNADKLNAFRDLLESTEDRLIVFYNFNDELNKMI